MRVKIHETFELILIYFFRKGGKKDAEVHRNDAGTKATSGLRVSFVFFLSFF